MLPYKCQKGPRCDTTRASEETKYVFDRLFCRCCICKQEEQRLRYEPRNKPPGSLIVRTEWRGSLTIRAMVEGAYRAAADSKNPFGGGPRKWLQRLTDIRLSGEPGRPWRPRRPDLRRETFVIASVPGQKRYLILPSEKPVWRQFWNVT